MKAKLIVFDIAGTILQDNEDIVASAFLEVLKTNGFELGNHDIKWVMGYKKRRAIEMLLEREGISLDEETIDRIHNQFLSELNKHYQTAAIQEVNGVSKLFKQLKKKDLKIALNTGFNRSTTDIIIGRLGWLKNSLIDDSVASDEVEHGRPEPDMIRELRERFNIAQPGQVFKIGDTPSDLLEGKNAGCGKTIGVLYGTHNRQELEKYPHDYLAENVQDLTTAIFSNGS